MEYKSVPTVSKVLEDRVVEGFASIAGNIDDGSDIIHFGAFRKTIKERGPRVRHLWQHDFTRPPIAKILELKEVKLDELPSELRKIDGVEGGLKVVREYLTHPEAQAVFEGVRTNAINEMSIGFDPIKFDFDTIDEKGLIRHLREVRLWDTSDVNWGMNPVTMASKSAILFKDTGKVAENTPWTVPSLSDFTDKAWEDLADHEKTRIAAHFAFSATAPAESFEDLKFPHHQAGKTGIGPAVWRGVAAAMAALLGVREGVDLPSSDRKAVFVHIAKHYDQFKSDPIDFKLVELSYLTRDLVSTDLKAGRVLSASNLGRLKDALSVLSEILLSAEPEEDNDKLLSFTENVLARLAIASRDPVLLHTHL